MDNRRLKYTVLRGLIFGAALSLTACTTITDYFTPDEEVELRVLEPIQNQFTPNTKWSEEVGDGVDKYFSRLRPAIGYDLLFAASRQGDVIAFNPETGDTVWKKDFADYSSDGESGWFSSLWSDGLSAKIAGGLSVAYEKLYFGTENGDVIALNAKTGEQIWHSKVKGEVMAAPAIDAGVVVVNTGAGTLFALDAETGEQKWFYESDVPALSLRGISAPAVAGGGAIVGTATGKLAVGLLESGQIIWEQTISAASGATELERMVDIDSQPLVAGGTVYAISYDGTLASLDLRSGRVVWKREYKSYRRISMTASQLFVVDVNGNIYGLDRRNGIEQWSQGALKGRTVTSAEPYGNYLVAGDAYGVLHWLDQATGEFVARIDIGDSDLDRGIFVAPLVSGNMVYAQTRDGELFAIETP